MNKWGHIRTVLIVMSVVPVVIQPWEVPADIDFSWISLILIFLAVPLCLLFVLAIQVVNPESKRTWSKPTWNANPFRFDDPLQFFHFAAYGIFAQGAAGIVHAILYSSPFGPYLLAPFAMGAGALIGLRLVIFVFKNKFMEGT